MVIQKYGTGAWEKVLEMSGLPKDTCIVPTENAHDEIIGEVLNNLCRVLDISIMQASEAFGEYWVGNYAPKMYSNFHILAPTARDFLMKLNDIHAKVVKTMKETGESCVPRFKCKWDGESLLLTFDSKKGLTPFLVGLIKGVGKYYDEEVVVSMWSDNTMLIKFPQEGRQNSEEREPKENKA